MAGTQNVTLKMIGGLRYAIPKLKADPLLKGETITVDRATANALLADHWIDAAQNEQPYFKELSSEEVADEEANAADEAGDEAAAAGTEGETRAAGRTRGRSNK